MSTIAKGSGLLKRVFHRLASSPDQLQSEDLRAEAEAAGAQTLDACMVRKMVHLHGTVSVVTVNPRESRGWLEAELTDGTGHVTLVWMGRHAIPGIEAGRKLHVRGRLAQLEGRLVIHNPEYALLPS